MDSNLPPAEEIRKQQSIEIRRQIVTQFESTVETLEVELINNETQTSTPVITRVHRIPFEAHEGFLPSKMWIRDADDHVEMLTYHSPSLPTAARAFGEQDVYMMQFAVDTHQTVQYPADARVYIDQLPDCHGKLWYVFLFGEDEAHKLIRKVWSSAK